MLRQLYLASLEREREKHPQCCPKPTPLARRPFEITVSQESGGGLFPLSAQSVSGKLSSREGTVTVGEGKGEEGCGLFIFGSAAFFVCREDGDDGCKELGYGEEATRTLSVWPLYLDRR